MNSLRRGLESSTTSMARLWRRKPWMKRSGLVSLSCVMMSRWTVGVAVAVRAMTGAGRRAGEEVAEGAVIGAKVMAPGGDAVGLVDGDEGRLASSEHLGEVGDSHALGRDEEKLEGTVEVVAAGLAGFIAGEAGVDAGDAEAGGSELGGLVVHEGDERADDECGAAPGDGGKLVTEGLSRSCGHDEQDVTAIGGGAADCLLVGAELGEAEGLVEEGFEVHLLDRVSHNLRARAKWFCVRLEVDSLSPGSVPVCRDGATRSGSSLPRSTDTELECLGRLRG